MLTLKVTYLMGRAYASRFEDAEKTEAEWPPHPGRLFCALTAAWGESGQSDGGRHALERLESQAAPEIHYENADARTVVRTYIPPNDRVQTLTKKKKPIDYPWRERKGRRFPSVTPHEPSVYFSWPDASPSNDVEAHLRLLASRTASVGHSSSVVEVEVGATAPPRRATVLTPRDGGPFRLRVLRPGRLRDLESRYARFEETGLPVFRPDRGPTAAYGEPSGARPVIAAGSIFGAMAVLRRTAGDELGLARTLKLTAALRGAIVRKASQPLAEWISGHTPEGRPSEAPHIGLAPLGFVGSPHADGRVLGLGVLLPAGLSDEQQRQWWPIFHGIEELTMGRAGRWVVEPSDAHALQANLRPSVWTNPSRTWATVTPFVFDRAGYPLDSGGPKM